MRRGVSRHRAPRSGDRDLRRAADAEHPFGHRQRGRARPRALPASARRTPESDLSGRAAARSTSASTSARSRLPRASYSQPTTAGGCGGARVTSKAVERVVLEEDKPVVEARLLSVTLASRHARRELEPSRSEEPGARTCKGRMSALERDPRDRGIVFSVPSPLAHPCDHPRGQAHRFAALVVQCGDELLEADVVLGKPRSLRPEQRRQPCELLVRREETLRTISIPSNVLPDPGGATMCVRRRPWRRSCSNASSASS